jgi:hypothetical protein
MKYWLLTLLVITGCAGTLTWIIQKKVIPSFLAHANEELVADWHAGLTEYRKENGAWPDLSDPAKFRDQVYILLGADGRRIQGGYMNNRPNRYEDGVFPDKYSQPMKVTIEGENLLVASAGPNQTWGDADDVTSGKVGERYRPLTLAPARAAAGIRSQKSP